jgi:hypothetical protein
LKEVHVLHNGSEPSVTEISAFIQTWLYFGLLSTTIGPIYRTVDFHVQDHNGQQILSTARFQDLIGPWSQALVAAEDFSGKVANAYRNIEDVRRLAYRIVLARPEILRPEILLSLALLGEALSQALMDVRIIAGVERNMTDTIRGSAPWRHRNDKDSWDPARPLFQFIDARGWFPSDLARMESTI